MILVVSRQHRQECLCHRIQRPWVHARVGESIARSAKIAKHRRNWKQLLLQRKQRRIGTSGGVEKTPWCGMARDTLWGPFGAPSASLGISPACSNARRTAQLRLRANDRLWKYILAALRSG